MCSHNQSKCCTFYSLHVCIAFLLLHNGFKFFENSFLLSAIRFCISLHYTIILVRCTNHCLRSYLSALVIKWKQHYKYVIMRLRGTYYWALKLICFSLINALVCMCVSICVFVEHFKFCMHFSLSSFQQVTRLVLSRKQFLIHFLHIAFCDSYFHFIVAFSPPFSFSSLFEFSRALHATQDCTVHIMLFVHFLFHENF